MKREKPHKSDWARWGEVSIVSEELAEPGSLLSRVGDWRIVFDGVRLRLQRSCNQAREEIALNAFGYGAFTVLKDESTRTYFRDGKSSTAKPARETAIAESELRPEIGFLQLVPKNGAVIKIVHRLDQRTWELDTRRNVLRVSRANEQLLSIAFNQKSELPKPDSVETTSLQATEDEPSDSLPRETKEWPAEGYDTSSSNIQEPEEPETVAPSEEEPKPEPRSESVQTSTEPATSDNSPANQAALTPENSLLLQSGQRIPLNLPIKLKSKERNALRLVAEYGQLTDKSLEKAMDAKRPVRPRMSRLIDKLNKAGIPLIEEGAEHELEGYLYTFNLAEAERMGNQDDQN